MTDKTMTAEQVVAELRDAVKRDGNADFRGCTLHVFLGKLEGSSDGIR